MISDEEELYTVVALNEIYNSIAQSFYLGLFGCPNVHHKI
jgi:hypothetical protein